LVTLAIFFAVCGFGQSADITGWSGILWGTTKAAAMKELRTIGAHECTPASSASCVKAPGIDELLIDRYRSNGISFAVNLLFTKKNGLDKVILTAGDERDAFEKELARLKGRYGKPGLQSEYDGEEEVLHTTWIWSKAHGKVSLETEERTGVFTITFEARR